MTTISTPIDWGDLFDAGPLIGALLEDDPRHAEAFPLVNAARAGEIRACTTTGILSEVYAALTWHQAKPLHTPSQSAQAILRLIEPPSRMRILPDGLAAALKAMGLAARHGLTARRIHDARHAGAALAAGVTAVYTYDVEDWKVFADDGLSIVGPASSMQRLSSV